MLRRNLLPTSFTASPNSSDFFHHRRLDMLEEESTVPSTVEGPTRVANAQPSSGIPHDVLTNHPQQRKGTISERDINDDPVHPPSENRKYPLDKKARFWEEYDRYAHKYDDELVKGLSDDLNSLLIFAGLFSATNTAFILEIMKDLKGDPLDTTNHLLQALIRVHDANHVAASTEEPQISVPDKRTVRVNAFFFASLCCSIFAAFGAVLGKQWLNHYDHEGPPKSLPEKGRDRQMKLMGLERWHVHGILQLLPAFLQIALFFFLVGLIDWLWPLSRMVAGVVFGFTLVTLLFYIMTTAVAMYDPGSPFQSRISRYLRAFSMAVLKSSRQYKHAVLLCVTHYGLHALWLFPFILVGAALGPSHWFISQNSLPPSPLHFTRLVIIEPCITILSSSKSLFGTFDNQSDIDTGDVMGVECVSWLFQQCSAHAGSVVAVLDAAGTFDASGHRESELLLDIFHRVIKPSAVDESDHYSLGITSEGLGVHIVYLSPLVSAIKKVDHMLRDGPLLHPRFWAEFCSRFWDLLCQPTISEEVVRSGLQVLRSMGFSHTSRSRLKFTGSDVMILCDKLLLSLERSNLDALDLSPFQQDYLTLFGLAYVSHLENTVDRSEVTRLPMDHRVLHALLIASLEINGSPDNDGWRGRLRLLYLLQMPDIAYSFVLPVARRFLAFLERIMTSDDGQNPDSLLSQLYPHVICLLLTRDHDVWFEELRDSNHLNRFRSLLAGQPSDIPLDRQALLATQTFPGVLAPLYCFMTIWRQCKSQDVLTAKYNYLTSDWAARVDQALSSFVNPNSWTSFSWDISSRAVSEMIASIHEFVELVVENGLLSEQASGNIIHKAMMFQQNLQRNFRRRLS